MAERYEIALPTSIRSSLKNPSDEIRAAIRACTAP